jgi:hypothetical protein
MFSKYLIQIPEEFDSNNWSKAFLKWIKIAPVSGIYYFKYVLKSQKPMSLSSRATEL